jgi:hypothetical protein
MAELPDHHLSTSVGPVALRPFEGDPPLIADDDVDRGLTSSQMDDLAQRDR